MLFLPPVFLFFVTCVYSLREVAILARVAVRRWASALWRGDGGEQQCSPTWLR